MIKYYVRTTLDRTLDESYKQIEYQMLIDKEHRFIDSFIDQLKQISDTDSVLLEDDLELCFDFKKRIEDVIRKYPDRIINFFTIPKIYFTTRETEWFVYNQCTYYPKGMALKVAQEMEKLRTPDINQYDTLEDMALKSLGMSHIVYRPCLVQHLNFDTLINNTVGDKRRTPFYIEYLNELKFNYNKITKMHYGILNRKLNEHIAIKYSQWLKNQNKPKDNAKEIAATEVKPKKKRTTKKKEEGEASD